MSAYINDLAVVKSVVDTLKGEQPRHSSVGTERLGDLINARFEEFKVTMKDGVAIKARVKWGAEGKNSKVMMFAPPLGVEDSSIYLPLIHRYGDLYTYLSWNYRGLFGSDTPKRAKRISIRDHAEDAEQILDYFRIQTAEVLVGHSMGVQVALEFCLLYADRVNSLVLINGAYGHVFKTAFQPYLRVPFAGYFSEALVENILGTDAHLAVNFLQYCMKSRPATTALRLNSTYFGSPVMKELWGDDYINIFMDMYYHHIGKTERDSENYLRLFQELNAHDSSHLLHTIQHPTLLISGMQDFCTPSYLMKEMNKKMVNSVHYADFWSTHATLFENPEFILKHTDEFLKSDTSIKTRVLRSSSTAFVAVQSTSAPPAEE